MSRSEGKSLVPYVSQAGALSYALGTSIGWGSLVITANTYLAAAGPVGSAAGLIAGALIMLIISRNYAYLMNRCPEAGGAYAYTRDIFGYDHGFLTAWFLALTYLAVFWANATSLPLFARYFIGDLFRKGRLYSLFGYDVYLGEALLSAAAIVLTAAVCAGYKKLTQNLMILMAAVFSAGIVICFLAAAFKGGGSPDPSFLPDAGVLSQVIRIAVISPWAFIGFENISHAAEEFNFPLRRSFRILTAAVVLTTALYICVILLSASAYPPQYGSWLEYIRDHGNLQGLEGLPAFYAAYRYLGQAGIAILMAALLALILTSLIGNTIALSRLFYALGRDRVLPECFGALNRQGIPGQAVYLTAALSVLIPFLGRTAIGWIVDVTTIGATILYGYVSACAYKTASESGDKLEKKTGLAGLVIMIGFGLYLLLPNLFAVSSMVAESYFLFVVWAVTGFFLFRLVLQKDREGRFGKSIIVWIALLSLVLFVSLVWMSQYEMQAAAEALTRVKEYYSSGNTADGAYLAEEIASLRGSNALSILVVIGVFVLSLAVLMNNYSVMSRRAIESEKELGSVRDMAHTDALTGVKNKRAYAEREEQLDLAIAEGTMEPCAIVVCDLNGLKHVNDTQGHKAGDEYIRSAAMLVCELFQHSPVFRIGGDEFVVILTGRDYGNRKELIGKLRETAQENIGTGKAVLSSGISEYRPGEDHRVHDIFERADARMYENKHALKAMGARTRA